MNHPHTFTVGSLFAGIGGFELGFERAGFTTVWQVEINARARKVLAKNFPKAERYEDVKECGKQNLKPVDVIVGGFPCQDISFAGGGAGIEGERSGLVTEFVRIIGELRPPFALMENVAALLGRGLGRVLGLLTEIGYDAEWEIVSAADVGAPHLRERIWILAYPVRDGRHTPQLRELRAADDRKQAGTHGSVEAGRRGACDVPNASGERCAEARELRHGQPAQRATGRSEDVANTEGITQRPGLRKSDAHRLRRRSGNGSRKAHHANRAGREELHAATITEATRVAAGRAVAGRRSAGWAVEPNVGRVAHGVPDRVDRLTELGNAVVPDIPERYAKRIKALLEEAV